MVYIQEVGLKIRDTKVQRVGCLFVMVWIYMFMCATMFWSIWWKPVLLWNSPFHNLSLLEKMTKACKLSVLPWTLITLNISGRIYREIFLSCGRKYPTQLEEEVAINLLDIFPQKIVCNWKKNLAQILHSSSQLVCGHEFCILHENKTTAHSHYLHSNLKVVFSEFLGRGWGKLSVKKDVINV